MIPNSAPMAAVFLRHDPVGSGSGQLFSLPVAAWSNSDAAMVVFGGVCLEAADSRRSGVQFLGLWQRGWSPSYDEMTGFLPEPREEFLVTARELTDGSWAAFRTSDGALLAAAATLGELEDALERHHLDCTIVEAVPLRTA